MTDRNSREYNGREMRLRVIAGVLVGVILGGALGLLITEKVFRASLLENFLRALRLNQTGAGPGAVGVPPAILAPRAAPPESGFRAPDYEEAVVNAVERAADSVVSIVISKDLPIIESCDFDPFGGGLFDDPFFRFRVPCERGTEHREVGGGSGFIISQDGLIVTNKHVVFDEKAEYTVLTNEGKKYPAEVLARDPVQDIAIIKISAAGLKAARLGDSGKIKLGQTAIAIGNALGEFRNTVSVGAVSGLARSITASGAGFSERLDDLIQTDAAINQGNSGGPLLNILGEVIGVNTAVASGAQNIGFAIPINAVKRDIDSVQATGEITAPFLGVRYILLTPEIAKAQGLPVEYGALVRGSEEGPGVLSGSPAEKAGLMAEDIILEVNGKKLSDGVSLGSEIQKYGVGESVSLKVLRGKDRLVIPVRLEKRP